MLYTKSPDLLEQFPQIKEDELNVIELNKNLKFKINKYYQQLLKSNFPFDAMCWALAELELIFEKGRKKYSEQELTKRAEKIFDITQNYDDLCWFIANLKIYLEEVKLYP